MSEFAKILLVILIFGIASIIPQKTNIGITNSLAIGEVIAIDFAKNEIQLNTTDGLIIVFLNVNTEFKRVSPDNPMDFSLTISSNFTEISNGDRIIAQGIVSADKKTIVSRWIILMTKTDISQKQEMERKKWLTNGITGRIISLDSERKEIAVLVRKGLNTNQTVTVAVNERTIYRRYAFGSTRFTDAKVSNFGELRIGDQLRTYSEKSSDETRIVAEEIIFGSFSIIGGKITAINLETSEIVVKDFSTNKDFIIKVVNDTLLRRFPPELAKQLAKNQTHQATKQKTTDAKVSGAGETDFETMLKQLPILRLSELKIGEAIAVAGFTQSVPNQLTAIKFLVGIEPFLKSAQIPNSSQASAPSLNIPGLEDIRVP